MPICFESVNWFHADFSTQCRPNMVEKHRQTAGENIKFFRIPKDEHMRAKWISAIKWDDWEPSENTRICSKHFINGKSS